MIVHRALVWAASAAFALGTAAAFLGSKALADGPTIVPSTVPSIAVAGATTEPTSESTAKVSPDARKLMDQVKDAYASLKSLDVTGTANANFSVDGRVEQPHYDLTGSYLAGGKFRSEVKDESVMGFTGEKQYFYMKHVNQYKSFDAPAGKVNLESMNKDITEALQQQNLSLALALAPDAEKTLLDGAMAVTKGDEVKIDDTSFPVLNISGDDVDVTLAIDPKSNLIRRQTLDLTKMIKGQGAREVKSAVVVVDFKNVANGDSNPQFAWAPPAGAQEYHPPKEMADAGGDASALKGQAAPAFSLDGLDGKKVATADVKGSVYILDFWATWCGPCVQSLPDLNKIYEDNKAAGLKVYAVNQSEEKDVVAKFVNDKKMTIPVLLDTDSKVGEAYGANAIPETVVVGKDGKVLEVFVGSGHDDEIRKLVESALKSK